MTMHARQSIRRRSSSARDVAVHVKVVDIGAGAAATVERWAVVLCR
jgi:hypothetical protein